MPSRYIANTPDEQKEMLGVIGAGSLEDLLVKIPPKARLARPLGLTPALAESDLIRHMMALAGRNAHAESHVSFLGAGSYDHYIPSPIHHMVLRGEFLTAYTPYQPEASQGTLRTIYEYQTMIAELTGMDVANASIYDGAPALAESDLIRHMMALAGRNAHAESHVSFLGAGSYDHYIPSPIHHMVLRGEFLTAYTPYQPEASQGTLRTIYEYQTMIAELTGMDVANASIYDGASSLAEAALMAHSVTERREIVLSRAVHPLYKRVTATYCEGPGVRLRDVPAPDGVTDLAAARQLVGPKT
ncbi:MAG: hypothetical protein DME00_25445, partial [Candidatus Rokuibacteriota bacterium]